MLFILKSKYNNKIINNNNKIKIITIIKVNSQNNNNLTFILK